MHGTSAVFSSSDGEVCSKGMTTHFVLFLGNYRNF